VCDAQVQPARGRLSVLSGRYPTDDAGPTTVKYREALA
jgi:hypothetical protein